MDWKSKQNADGGWAYSRGSSWTEPTALVLMAQLASGVESESFPAGVKFLRSLEGSDGGWRPQSGVAESNWVTALVGLLPLEVAGVPQHKRAIRWLKGQTGRESSLSFRLSQRLNGVTDEYPEAWPWFPGASSWVIPTSFALLAFQREQKIDPDSGVRDRIESGRRFLLARMCADGGWNHGGNRALGRDGDSYPETTGIALLALGGLDKRNLQKSLNKARQHLKECRTAEGIAWLRMGLAAHGEKADTSFEPRRRTIMDEALWQLASAPRNVLTGSV